MKTHDRFRWVALLFAGALAAACLLQAPRCLAEQKQSAKESAALARQKTDQGLDFVEKENYPAALEAFEEAYRLEPTPTRLYNVAMCKKALYR